MSWNKFYAGKHWSVRKKEAQRVHGLVKLACLEWRARHQSPLPKFSQAKIILTAYFSDHPLDASNICAKLYEDGLVAAGILPSDKYDVVTSIEVRSRKAKRPCVEIQVLGESDGEKVSLQESA